MEGAQLEPGAVRFESTASAVPAWRLADKGKPGVTRGRKATGLGSPSQPGCRNWSRAVPAMLAPWRRLLLMLASAVPLLLIVLTGLASVRPI